MIKMPKDLHNEVHQLAEKIESHRTMFKYGSVLKIATFVWNRQASQVKKLEAENARLREELSITKKIVQTAQGLLTGLNVGGVHSESLIHKDLRKTMIEYRKAFEALQGGGE